MDVSHPIIDQNHVEEYIQECLSKKGNDDSAYDRNPGGSRSENVNASSLQTLDL